MTVYLGQIAGPRQRVDDSLVVAVEAERDRGTAQQDQENRGHVARGRGDDGGGRFHFGSGVGTRYITRENGEKKKHYEKNRGGLSRPCENNSR